MKRRTIADKIIAITGRTNPSILALMAILCTNNKLPPMRQDNGSNNKSISIPESILPAVVNFVAIAFVYSF